MADDSGLLGMGAGQAQIIVAGGFGSLVLIHLRHPGTVLRVSGTLVTGIGVATLFTPAVAGMVPGWLAGVGHVQVAAILGLAGNALAAALLAAVEKIDFAELIGRKRGDG